MKQRSKIQNPPGTQAVGRAIAILRALAAQPRALGVTEVAAVVGVNKAAIFRVMGALEQEGLVVRDDNDAYRLGPDLISLGMSALGATDLRSAAHAELAWLVDETGETATLEVLDGENVLIIDEMIGRFLLGSVPELGLRWPAYATSSGKVLLAFSTNAPGPHALRKRAAHTITSRAAFVQELDRVRACGYATASEELEVGFSAVAAPIFDHRRIPVGAISVNGPTARIGGERLKALAQLAVRAAARASHRLGAPTTGEPASGTKRSAPTRPASTRPGSTRNATSHSTSSRSTVRRGGTRRAS